MGTIVKYYVGDDYDFDNKISWIFTYDIFVKKGDEYIREDKFRCYHLLRHVSKMLERKDSHETILDVIKYIERETIESSKIQTDIENLRKNKQN